MDKIKQMVKDYESGKHSPFLAKKYDLSIHEVLRLLRSCGIKVRSKGGSVKKYDQGWSQAFIDSYMSGESISSIAARMGVGFGTVNRALNAAKIKKRPNGLRGRTIPQLPLNEGIIGYFAGLLDGEGNIQFKPCKNKISYKIAIYNTNRDVMEWLHNTMGGSLRWDNKRVKKYGYKPCGIWALYRAQDITIVLKWCKPFIIIKKDAVDTFLALMEEKGVI